MPPRCRSSGTPTFFMGRAPPSGEDTLCAVRDQCQFGIRDPRSGAGSDCAPRICPAAIVKGSARPLKFDACSRLAFHIRTWNAAAHLASLGCNCIQATL